MQHAVPSLLPLEDLRRTTAPGLLLRRARVTPNNVALRAKVRGLYVEHTWKEYALLVAQAAKGLRRLGLGKGDRIAIMADVCREWLVIDQAAQALGAIVYGIYPTASAQELAYQMRDGGASIFVAEDQEYIDKILPLVADLPALEHLVIVDETALFAIAHEKLKLFREVLQSGADATLASLEEAAAQLDPAQPAFIVYTSGTTGHPKGALITHGKHLAATRSVASQYPMLNAREQRTVAYLPLCHVLGRDIAVTLPLLTGLVPHLGESVEDLPNTLFEVAPTVLFTVPRYLQKMASQILVGISGSSAAKRFLYAQAMAFSRGAVRRLWAGENNLADESRRALWRALVFRPILSKLGFDRLELVVSGGAPLPAETMTIWHMLGVNVAEMYGQTEAAGGIIAGLTGPFPRPGDVGTIPEGVAVRLGEDGEIQVRSEDLFEGYWNNPEAFAQTFTSDGWMRTGDVGVFTDGRLKLVDRVRDFIVTSGGKTISPSFIENILRASPFVAEAIVFGHGRKYLTALIEIDFDVVADWARTNGLAYTGFTNLATNPRVAALLQGELGKANAQVARVEQIKAFRILPKVLDPEEEGEPVTPTRKVKRGQMYERFKPLVEAMYDDREERLLAESAML